MDNIIQNYLKKDGCILLSWPRFEDLMIDESAIENNFNHEHINYFSVQTVDRLMSQLKFKRIAHKVSIGYQSGDLIGLSNIALYQATSEKITIKKDDALADSIIEYIDRIQDAETDLIKRINELVYSGAEIIVWGTGAYAMHLLAVSDLRQGNIKCFVDNNELKRKSSFGDYKVESPEVVNDFTGSVVIASMLYRDEIEKQICEMENIKCNIVG